MELPSKHLLNIVQQVLSTYKRSMHGLNRLNVDEMAGVFGMNMIYSLVHLIVNTNTSPIDKQVGFRHNDGIENWY